MRIKKIWEPLMFLFVFMVCVILAIVDVNIYRMDDYYDYYDTGEKTSRSNTNPMFGWKSYKVDPYLKVQIINNQEDFDKALKEGGEFLIEGWMTAKNPVTVSGLPGEWAAVRMDSEEYKKLYGDAARFANKEYDWVAVDDNVSYAESYEIYGYTMTKDEIYWNYLTAIYLDDLGVKVSSPQHIYDEFIYTKGYMTEEEGNSRIRFTGAPDTFKVTLPVRIVDGKLYDDVGYKNKDPVHISYTGYWRSE